MTDIAATLPLTDITCRLVGPRGDGPRRWCRRWLGAFVVLVSLSMPEAIHADRRGHHGQQASATGQVTTSTDPQRADEREADAARDRVMAAIGRMRWPKVYAPAIARQLSLYEQERNQDMRAVVAASALAMLLNEDTLPFGPMKNGRYLWSFDPLKFNPDLSDLHARLANDVFARMIAQELDAATAATWPAAPPPRRALVALQALARRVETAGPTSLGMLWLVDSPGGVSVTAEARGRGARDSIISLMFGPDTDQLRAWDADRSLTHRAGLVKRAVAMLIELATALVRDDGPDPARSIETFKSRVQIGRNFFGDDTPERVVTEAFGKPAGARLRALAARTRDGASATADPGAAREYWDLLRGAYALAACQPYAFLFRHDDEWLRRALPSSPRSEEAR